MKKNSLFQIVLVFVLIASASLVQAQQLGHYTQYLFSQYVINPAFAGYTNRFEAQLNNRYQWVGVTDAPRTYIFSVQGPLNNKNVGLGGYIYSDIVGPTRRTGGQFTYAYHLKLNEKYKLSMALSAGLVQFAIDGSKITTENSGDIALSNGFQSVITPDANAGFLFYSDQLFVGFSAGQILQNRLQFFNNYPETDAALVTHLFGMAGYKFEFGDFSVQPSVFVKYVDPVPVQAEGTLKFGYKDDLVWVAGSYRLADAFTAMAGFTLQDNIRLGYAYDIPFTTIRSYSVGTHEVMLSIRFKKRLADKPSAENAE